MSHTLITFLGKGQKQDGGYRQATYQFPGGNQRTSPYFGLALLEELSTSIAPVDHLLVLGTASSIWDALLSDEMEDSDLWIDLSGRVEKGTVDDTLLSHVASDVQQSMHKRQLTGKVTLRTIPFARNDREQTTILQQMADCVSGGDLVSLDITHGFRSLPMLGLVSAMFLKQLKHARIGGIYYGALEMAESGITPVIRLDGLLSLLEWLGAISAFRASGDYGVFAPVVHDDAAQHALLQAGFLEKTLNITQARKHLREANTRFAEMEQHNPMFHLFADELRGFTSWTNENTFAARQLAAARNALNTGEYARATALAIESLISRNMPPNADPSNYKDRNETKGKIEDACKGGGKGSDPFLDAYIELRDLRNALAHGTRPAFNTFNQQATLASEDAMKSRLRDIFNSIQPPAG